MKSRDMTVLWDDEVARLVIEFYRGMALFHFRVRAAPLTAVKRAFEMRPFVAKMLRGLGYEKGHLYIPAGDWMRLRFCQLLGFSECKRRSGWILMEATCA